MYIINVINKKPKNFNRRVGNGLEWKLRFRFYSGGLELGVFELMSVDWYPETKHIDDPFKIIKNPNSSSVPTKGEIKRKLNYAHETGTAPNLTKKEWYYKSKYNIPTKYNLDMIDSMETNTRAKRQLVEKLKVRRRNLHLTSQKNYEEAKSERIFKKIIKKDNQNVQLLEQNVKSLLEDSQDPQIGELWQKMAGPLLGTREDSGASSRKQGSRRKLAKGEDTKRLGP